MEQYRADSFVHDPMQYTWVIFLAQFQAVGWESFSGGSRLDICVGEASINDKQDPRLVVSGV